MRVLFVIQNVRGINTGAGGHYYSLLTTANALHPHITVGIIVAGNQDQFILRNLEYPTWNVGFGPGSVRSGLSEFQKVVRQFAPDVIHAFDVNSFWLARMATLRECQGLLLTKCGGAIPRYYPYVEDLVVFTRQDKAFFSGRKKFQSSRIHLIPNRVAAISPDRERINQLRGKLKGKGPVFLRIGRFASSYRSTLLQAATLVRDLNTDGLTCQLLCIGTVQHPEVVRQIKAEAKGFVTVITDPKYTHKASELIDIGQFVIGTGRSLMEASTRGKILLTPIVGNVYPAVVTDDNFERHSSTNFSPRNTDGQHDEALNYKLIVQLLQDGYKRREYKRLSKRFFADHFNIDSVVPRYIGLYESVRDKGQDGYRRAVPKLDLVHLSARVLLRLKRHQLSG